MKKIAIKAEKWADMKLAVDLLRSVNHSVVKRKNEHPRANKTILTNGICWIPNLNEKLGHDWEYLAKEQDLNSHKFEHVVKLEMPQDLNKLKELLGVEIEVKIPEYVEIIDNKDKHKTWEKYHIGSVCKVIGAHPIGGYGKGFTINNPKGGVGYLFNGDFKPSTKEAFEAQEDKKKPLRNTQRLVLIRDNKKLIVENAELKQTINTLSRTADILAQENSELIKKLYKIKGIL